MTPMALYLAFRRQRDKIFKTVVENGAETIKTTSSSDDWESSSSIHEDVLTLDNKEKTFSFNLDIKEWKKIQPLYSYKKRPGTSTYRRYTTLPKYKWSNLMKEKIWINSKLPCTWTLRIGNIKEEYTFNLHGKCSQCQAIIKIKTTKITDNFIKCVCIVNNYKESYEHNPQKKSRLTPYRRQQISKSLLHNPAIMVHHNLASQFFSSDDKYKSSCPVLPSIPALRKIKYEAKIGKMRHVNPIISLLSTALNPNQNNTIRDMSVYPNFRLYYWTNKQIEYYNEYVKQNQRVTITIDATGSFFKNIILPDGSIATKRLFLYAGIVTANEKFKSVPIFQMVSDSHSQRTISAWLESWLSSVDIFPHEVITDDSSALISACIQTFTLIYSTKEYIRKMFSVLERQDSDVPNSYMRLDTSHFVKTLHNLTCFQKDVNDKIKYFYIKCILVIKNAENFQVVKHVIKDIIEVCLGQENTMYNNNSDLEATLSRLNKKIENINLPNFTPDSDLNEISDPIPDDSSINFPDNFEFMSWFDKLVETIKNKNQSKNVSRNGNSYYFPVFIPTFKRLLFKLPLWSNVLCATFNSENKAPSSSGIEAYFKTLKHLIFKTKVKRYRVDEFLKLHSDYLDGEIKSALCDLNLGTRNKITSTKARPLKRKITNKQSRQKNVKKSKLVDNHTFSTDSIFHDEPSFTENWKGEGRENQIKFNKNVKFIKNGNLCPSVKVGFNDISVNNTCAFDAVMYLLSEIYNQNEHFRSKFTVDGNNLISKISTYIKSLCDYKCKTDEIYKLRAEIISQTYNNMNKIRDALIFNCECNVSTVFEEIINCIFHSVEFSKYCSNPFCETGNILKRCYTFISLNVQLIINCGISVLEEAILINDEKKECLFCNNEVTYEYEPTDFISFDLNGTPKHKISEIPRTIKVKQNFYKLVGAIEFIPGFSDGDLGHYRGHYFFGETIRCYDDLKSKFCTSAPTDQMFLHTLSYCAISGNV